MKSNNHSFTRETYGYFDAGLRIYMLSIYRNMSMALGISALVAYIVGSSSQITMMCTSQDLILQTPLFSLSKTVIQILTILFSYILKIQYLVILFKRKFFTVFKSLYLPE